MKYNQLFLFVKDYLQMNIVLDRIFGKRQSNFLDDWNISGDILFTLEQEEVGSILYPLVA